MHIIECPSIWGDFLFYYLSNMKKNKTIKAALQILHIDTTGLHLLVKAKINNKSARLILDTGASRTVLDMNRISRFVKSEVFEKQESVSTGLGTSSMESHIVAIKKMEIGMLKLSELTFVLLDLSHVNQSYLEIGLKEIDGVVGGDILMQHKAVINYGKKTIQFTNFK